LKILILEFKTHHTKCTGETTANIFIDRKIKKGNISVEIISTALITAQYQELGCGAACSFCFLSHLFRNIDNHTKREMYPR